ncbi:hypothetical protein CLV63_102108 [Murinocardiopsis flavida]|uniref:Uncharacterized protein n=1 Tax=Murinocardiopsis flavida TaxID=645275 RepID=A0A2P8DRZ7_9ACTN|nr:hypothetical protein [Murinocardiopsis flavida]PSK99981.1 hypothetical protein CLV63_102108 [Murinocardiopsis flavida]
MTRPRRRDAARARRGPGRRTGTAERARASPRCHRILWGGYDAVYHYSGRVRAGHDTRAATFERLAAQFGAAFPALADARFTHAWGGAIDTCTCFAAFFDAARRRAARPG